MELEEEAAPPAVAVFFDVEPEKEMVYLATVIKGAVDEAAAAPVKVKVVEPYRVLHEGKPYVGGNTVEVPADVAKHWIVSGWATPVPQKGKS